MSFTSTLLNPSKNPVTLIDPVCGGISATTTASTLFKGTLAVGAQATVVGTIDYIQQHGSVTCPHAFTSTVSVTVAQLAAASNVPPVPAPVVSAGGACWKSVSNTQEWPANCLLYAANSPWNRPITNPDSPILFPNSNVIMASMLANTYAPGGINTLFIPGGPGVPSPYISSANDPLITYSCRLYCGGSQLSSGAQFRVPQNTTAIGTGDAVMSVIQPNGDEVDCWETPQGTWSNGQSFAAGSCTLFPNVSASIGWLSGGIPDDAVRTNDITLGSASTSGIAVGESFIRASELQAGAINHAIGMDTFCESGIVYPATHYDNVCTIANGIPAGARVWSDLTDAQVNGNANLTPDDKTILIALHHYGAYVRDSNSNSNAPPGHFSLYLDQGGTVGASETPMYLLGQQRSQQAVYIQAGEWQHITSPDRYIFGDPWLPNVSGGILSHLHIVDTCYAAGTC